MMDQEKMGKYFIVGAGVLVVLVIGALVWAMSISPSEEAGLKFNDDGDPSLGPANAKVVIREFSDFECPGCKIAEESAVLIRQEYGDKMRFVWNDFPLAMHKSAVPAAIAARCAEEQGKFWEYHDRLFAEQEKWSTADAPSNLFVQYAKDLSLDADAFSVCISVERHRVEVNNDAKEGVDNKIRATPTFFINNKRFEGAVPKETLRQEIEEALKR